MKKRYLWILLGSAMYNVENNQPVCLIKPFTSLTIASTFFFQNFLEKKIISFHVYYS